MPGLARAATGDLPVVTGIGVLAPNGSGTDAYWKATLAGVSGIDRIRRFDAEGYPCSVAGEIDDFNPRDLVPGRLRPQLDRMSQLAVVAADWALRDAAADPEQWPEYQRGVVTAGSSGGVEFGQGELQRLWTRGSTAVGAYLSIAWFYAASTGQISIRRGLRGPCGVLATEQAGGLDAVGQARRLLRTGSGLVLAGGTDASLCPWGLVTQLPGDRLSTRSDPRRAYLPFDVDAAGHVPGEGGALLVLETAASARARGAVGYGAIAGYAATFDPPPYSDRPPGLARVIRSALDDAGMTPAEVQLVLADGSGVPRRDRQEAQAITEVFGPFGVPVSVPKTMVGRLYAGGGALDLATALLAVRHGVAPPTIGVSRMHPDDRLDVVRDTPRELPLRAILVLARGHGGFNSAVVVTRSPLADDPPKEEP